MGWQAFAVTLFKTIFMLKLLQTCLDKEPLTATPYMPTNDSVALQLVFPKGIIIDLFEKNDTTFLFKVFEGGDPQQKPKFKAFYEIDEELFAEQYEICSQIFDKHFSVDEQNQTCDHFATLINGYNPPKAAKLSVNKGN